LLAGYEAGSNINREWLKAKILLSVISSLLEMSAKVNDAMEFSSWCKCAEAADGLLNLLDENRNVTLTSLVTEDEENLAVS
jgi:Eukaryotic translation initiation factor 3 subunit 8 N-terminus